MMIFTAIILYGLRVNLFDISLHFLINYRISFLVIIFGFLLFVIFGFLRVFYSICCERPRAWRVNEPRSRELEVV